MAMSSYFGSQRLIERQREVPGKSLLDKKFSGYRDKCRLLLLKGIISFKGIFATDHNNERLLYNSRVTEPEMLCF